MAIDFAGDLERIVTCGDFPAVTGTLTQDGASIAFTKAVITRRRRLPEGGNKDQVELDVVLVASGVAVEPRVDSRSALSPIDGASELDGLGWLVVKADPIAPGGPVAGFRLTLRTWVVRDPAI